ncbi:undecaprenyl-diphosphatase 2 [Streptomyces avidinii]
MALIPGVSRSGATISGGLLLGFTREAAARYSFLLAIPAVLASGAFEIKDVMDTGSHLLGADDLRDGHRLLRGLRRDRVVHEVHLDQELHALRDLPDSLGILLFVLIGTDVLSPHAGESGS